jgi:transposase-like protein
LICITNCIEQVTIGIRKLTENLGPAPSEVAPEKLFYLALRNISKKGTMPICYWKATLHRFGV